MPDDARQWQARIVDISGWPPYNVNEMLETTGTEGGEPVAFDQMRLLFKRPAPPEKKGDAS